MTLCGGGRHVRPCSSLGLLYTGSVILCSQCSYLFIYFFNCFPVTAASLPPFLIPAIAFLVLTGLIVASLLLTKTYGKCIYVCACVYHLSNNSKALYIPNMAFRMQLNHTVQWNTVMCCMLQANSGS